MLAGLSFKASDIRIGLRYDGTDSHTGDGTGTFQWDASLTSFSIFNTVSLSDGIQLSIESTNTPSPLYIHSFAIPELAISDSDTAASYETAVESYLILKDAQVIETSGSPWRLVIGSVEWWLNGLLFGTYAGGTLNGTGLGPGYVPLLGIPPVVTGNLNPGGTGYPISLPTLWQATTTATLTAFYEFKPETGDAWQSLPIALITPTVPSCFSACQRCLSASGIVSGSDTSAIDLNLSRSTGLVTIEAGGKYFTQGNVSSVEGSFWIVPNLDKSVVKLGSSYAALIERYGLPFTQYTGTRSCGPATPPPGPPVPSPYIETQTVTGEVHPEYTAFLGTVQTAAHVIEDPLSEISYVPVLVSNNAEVTQWVDDGFSGGPINPALWPDPLDGFLVETVTYQFPSKTQNRTRYTDPNADMPAYLDWSDGEASPTWLNNVITYWSCVVHPHWLYWYHVQDWEVDGAPVAYDDYWGYLCDQQLYNAALPTSDNLLSRTSLVSAPLLFGGNTGFIETFVAGTKTSFWGIPGTNLRIDRPTIPTSVIATGPDRWTLTDCTATWAATTVTATSTGASTIKLKYDLANWDYSPRMLTTLAKEFTLAWNVTNITAVAVNLIGIDGKSYELATTQGTFPFPVGLINDEYAGTWAQDFGAGTVTDGPGTDLLPEGDSPAAMADSTRVVACQYLLARGAKYLEIVVDVLLPAVPVTLDLPVLVMPDPDWSVIYEGSQFGAALDPDGPGIRFGNVNFWNYTLDIYQYPPTVLSPTSKPTVIDWLSFREAVLRGTEPNSTIDALIAIYFESGVEYTLRKHLAYETIVWWMEYTGGLQGVMVNTYCPPPLALFPGRSRDGELNDAGAWDQRVYSRVEHPRNFITPYNPVVQDLSKSPDTNWLTPQTALDGWSIASHVHPLDNDETDYVLSLDSKQWAEMRPWHGMFWVDGLPAEAMEPNAYAVSQDARHARGYIIGTTLRLGFSSNGMIAWTEVDTGITDVESLTMAYVTQGKLNVLYVTTVETGTAKLYTLDNESGALSLAISGPTASHAATDFGDDGVIRFYRLESGTVYVRAYSANLTPLYAEQTTNLTGIDDAEIDVRHSIDGEGKIRIGLLHFVGASPVCSFSTDGITFA